MEISVMDLPRFSSSSLVAILVASLVIVGSPSVLADTASADAEKGQGSQPQESQEYGEPLSQAEVTPIEEILANPAAWDGKTVRIVGRVGEVCPRQGCWMDLVAKEDGSEGSVLRVKVEDGVIVFPADARGSLAEAEGVVTVMEMTRERYIGWLAHQAEEKGQELDPSTVGEGPFHWVQVAGVGARLTRP